jgi:hypothetical protein
VSQAETKRSRLQPLDEIASRAQSALTRAETLPNPLQGVELK